MLIIASCGFVKIITNMSDCWNQDKISVLLVWMVGVKLLKKEVMLIAFILCNLVLLAGKRLVTYWRCFAAQNSAQVISFRDAIVIYMTVLHKYS